ncbi:MAG: glutamate dehydrogenase [Cytophagaceae bacterium]|nr:glutamate dehydrogenase [Cytophagaceae bacterium]
MKTRNLLMVLVITLSPLLTRAQFDFSFSNEIGVLAGPLLFQSDFGLRNNFDTNISNLGVGVGIFHYINFAYRADCNCYSRDVYFNDHFMIRSELDYHVTNLSHEGPLAEKDNDEGRDLRDHLGKSNVFEAGIQLEWHPMSIRDFNAGGYALHPFVSVGAHYVNYKPQYSSIQDVPGATPEDIFFDDFLIGDGALGGIDDSRGQTWALTLSGGMRYKLDELNDIFIEMRYHKYFSNWVDGLNPDEQFYPPNKYDDSIVWLMVGYVYYLNF